MKIKKSTLKNTSIVISILALFILLFGVILNLDSEKPVSVNGITATPQIEGDNQILDLTAKWGYSPEVITAVADKASILRVKTNTTFDCSAAFTIPSLGINKNLPPSGITEFKIPAQKPGTEINGTCSMGMYNFKIKFN